MSWNADLKHLSTYTRISDTVKHHNEYTLNRKEKSFSPYSY